MIRTRKVRTLRTKKGLLQFARNIKSQHGEDGIISKLVEILLPNATDLFCVDIGAWDGIHLSNTYNLTFGSNASQWTGGGVFVEADKERFKALQDLYKTRKKYKCINTKVLCEERNQENSLSAILDAHDVPRDLALISIDVDGIDYWLLRSILEKNKYRPRIVVVEFNPTIPHSVIYVQPRSDTVRHGSSLAAFEELMKSFQYVLVETTTYNAFFVPLELYKASKKLQDLVPDTSIEVLNEISMGTSMYQLYDGTLKLSGCKKMLWHRIRIDEEKIQMIDKSKRDFPFKPSTATTTTTQSVFAYGTLRPDFREDGGGDKYGVTNDVSMSCLGYVEGFKLFQENGVWYPFCVETENKEDRVVGYCMTWNNLKCFQEKLQQMDRIEGSTYQRRVVNVKCKKDGKTRRAYIYVQNKSVMENAKNVKVFPDGDWMSCRRHRRTTCQKKKLSK